MKSLRLGYVPYSNDLSRPGDRRRFCRYALKRNLSFEIADPRKSYDVVVVSEGGDLSVWSRYKKGKVVYDLVDAYLDIPRWNGKGIFRGAAKFLAGQSRRLILSHWKAVRDMCARSDAVLCGSPEQRERLLPFGNNVHVVWDDHSDYRATKEKYEPSKPFRLCWEGLPHNAAFFKEIRGPLRKVASRHSLELHLVTAPVSNRFFGRFGSILTRKHLPPLPFPVLLHPWLEQTASTVLTTCDLALIPLPLKDPFNALKPENKLLIFWRMGMPALVSATPAYSRVMEEAGMTMTCRTLRDWETLLEKFVTDSSARRAAGDRGRAYVAERYSEELWLARWDAMFASLGVGE